MLSRPKYTIRRKGRDGHFFHIVDMRGKVVAFAIGIDEALKKRFQFEYGIGVRHV